MTDEQETLFEEQLTAISFGEHAQHGKHTSAGHRADHASMTLPMINAAIRHTLAHHEAGKPTRPDYPPPYDRLTALYDARHEVLALF